MNKPPASLPRRQLLAGTGATVTAAALAGWMRDAAANTAAPAATARPLPAYVNWKDANSLIAHTNTTIETRRSAFGTSIVTPDAQLYIRNNLPAPDASIVADRDAWEVSIEGVRNPRTLTVRGCLWAAGVL
jgi:sulfite dehydrogenase